jgi:hypothetical protein
MTDSCPTCSGLRGESSGHTLAFLRCLYDMMAKNVPRSSAQSSGPLAQEAYCCLRTGPLSKVSPLTPTFVRFLRRFALSSVRHPFSATHFLGHCFGLIPASCSFASSAFPVPPLPHWVPFHKAATRFGSRSPRFWVPQENGARKRRFKKCLTYQFSNTRRVCWFRPGATSGERQRFEVHRILPSHTTLVEECR